MPELSVDIAPQRRRLPLGTGALRALGEFVLRRERARHALLSLTFVSRAEIARLNRAYLGRRGVTDVITFAMRRHGRGAPVIGDVYVAPDVVREQARRHGVPRRQEMARVVVHGILHALGMDHPEDRGRTSSPMWRRQEALLAQAQRRGLI